MRAQHIFFLKGIKSPNFGAKLFSLNSSDFERSACAMAQQMKSFCSGRFWIENQIYVRYVIQPTSTRLIFEDLSKPSAETNGSSSVAVEELKSLVESETTVTAPLWSNWDCELGGRIDFNNMETFALINKWSDIYDFVRKEGASEKENNFIMLPDNVKMVRHPLPRTVSWMWAGQCITTTIDETSDGRKIVSFLRERTQEPIEIGNPSYKPTTNPVSKVQIRSRQGMKQMDCFIDFLSCLDNIMFTGDRIDAKKKRIENCFM
jgi:hypothetical protein